jgi:hypothetical protein
VAGKVFSITDFRHGLDTRRSEISAPSGTLRILENAVINQGGEIEKRLAFVNSTTLPAPYGIIHGHADTLHAFGVGSAPAIPAGSLAVPIVGHALQDPGETIIRLADVEAYNDKFQVTGLSATRWYTWYDGVLVQQDGAPAFGTYSRTYKTKMYRTYGGYLYFSGVGDPSVTDPASVANPGAGFINLALNDPEGEGVNGMEVFYSNMAVFARLTTQIWNLDPDPTKDTLAQVLRIGAVAPFTVTQFGTGDVVFLSDSGVRSLKALTISLAASVGDVGSAIDLILVPAMRALAGQEFWAQATVQPIQGRYWMALSDTIYVLSYFASSDITAWSTFKPGFTVNSFAVVSNRVFALDASNNVWAYGGADLNTYDPAMTVTVRTPHHSADEPTTNKRIKSVDVVCTGPWSVSIGMLPNRTDQFELCANIQDNTLGVMSIPFAGYGTHFGVQMQHTGPGPATISAIHFNVQEGVMK